MFGNKNTTLIDSPRSWCSRAVSLPRKVVGHPQPLKVSGDRRRVEHVILEVAEAGVVLVQAPPEHLLPQGDLLPHVDQGRDEQGPRELLDLPSHPLEEAVHLLRALPEGDDGTVVPHVDGEIRHRHSSGRRSRRAPPEGSGLPPAYNSSMITMSPR
jgi:hypothetical protein